MAENWDDDDCKSAKPVQQQKNSDGYKNNNDDKSDYYKRDTWVNSSRSNNSRNENYQQRNRNNSRYNNQTVQNDYEQSQNQTQPENNEKMYLFIKTSQLGRIIGKRGIKIREIQDSSQAKVQINKDNVQGDSTEIEICGSKAAQNLAKSIIEELTCETFHSNERNARDSVQQPETAQTKCGDEDDKMYIFIQTSQLGRIIGRKGSKINEIQDTSQTKITINNNNIQGDRTEVEIKGSKIAQESAKSIIDELVDDSFVATKDNIKTFDNQPISEVSAQDNKKFEVMDWDKINREFEEEQVRKWGSYPPIIKEFYFEHPEVTNLTDVEVEQIRLEKNNINVGLAFKEGSLVDESYIPKPVTKFEHAFEKYPEIMDEIRKNQFETPSPIQCQAWPILMSGKDLIGIAQTGTGKTLAFLLPALIHIDGQMTPRDQRKGPTCMIMAPTRELALQIEREVNKYNYKDIKALCIYGGGDRAQQKKKAAAGVEIVIATPGRLNDLVQSGAIDVDCVSYLVLDEADRMLDMGFEPQIRKTLLDIRPNRQTAMTSATWPAGVRRLATSYMKDPITVCVGTMDLAAVHSVTQKVFIVEEEEKRSMLEDFIHGMSRDDKAMIFFGRKDSVDNISGDLSLKGIRCQSIHGGREQSDREGALEDFKTGEVQVLLATDVASRGIDIEDVTHVINYDFPRDIEEYVHRVGRTGRAGRTGVSISIMTRRDWSHAAELIKIMEEANQEIPDDLYSMAERYEQMKKRRSEEDRGGNSRGRRGGGNRRGGNNRWN